MVICALDKFINCQYNISNLIGYCSLNAPRSQLKSHCNLQLFLYIKYIYCIYINISQILNHTHTYIHGKLRNTFTQFSIGFYYKKVL